jgi:hypothetical protein
VTAPEKVAATVAPAAPNGSNGWYTTPVTVTVDTGGAPLWMRQVSLDGGATWSNTDADGEATVDADGTTTVQYRAVDSAGTVAPGGTVTLRIDKTAPAPTVTGIAAGATYGDSLTRDLVIGATDATSGVASTTATLDGQPVATGASSVALYRLSLGEHTLAVTSTDAAGNTGTSTVPFTTDTSFEDMRALIADLVSNKGQRNRLTDQLDAAAKSASRGDTAKAIRQLGEFKDLVRRERTLDGALRAALLRDADAMIDRLSSS